MIQIPGYPDYYVDGKDIISTKYGKRRVLSQSVAQTGYKKVKLSNNNKATTCMVHRLMAQAYLPDYSKDLHVEHEDRNKTNNDISNLRMATHGENRQNTDACGFYFHKASGKYMARITLDGNVEYIGIFNTAKEARDAYIAKKLILHPFYTHKEDE